MMDKSFDAAAVEARVSALWNETGAFRAGRPERIGAEPFCIVIPPPNVTGTLHIGHALNNTLQDILARYRRMSGRDVLWQPGTDHAGIATQMVVERKLMEAQAPDRRTMGREAFLERVWAWKAEFGRGHRPPAERLGASCDWSRERFTLDEGLSRGRRQGLRPALSGRAIYRDKRLVNWDPKLQTAISDLEVVQIECKGSFRWSREEGVPLNEVALAKVLAKNPNGHLYYFDYPWWIGRRGDRRRIDGRHHPARDHARRHGGRGPSRRRALQASGRQARAPAAGRPADPDRRRRIRRPRKGHGRGQDHPGARLQRLRGRQAARGGRARRSTSSTRRRKSSEGELAFFEGLESDHDHDRLSPRSTARTASPRASASSR